MTNTVSQVDPDKIHLIGLRLLGANYESSEEFLKNPVIPARTNVKIGQNTGLNLEKNLFVVKMEIILRGLHNDDSEVGLTARYLIEFAFTVDNLKELVQIQGDTSTIDSRLAATVLGIAYSTARGIVVERTQGTFFNGAILPVINPVSLVNATPEPQDTSATTEKT
jgi:hypothetical protein